jgi:hypothetical protein
MHRAQRVVQTLVVGAGLFWLSACLLEEVRHDLYLEVDGGLTWTVLEERIRSDAPDTVDGQNEEATFLKEAADGAHGVAKALRLLGAEQVSSHLLRDRRPFAVWTEGRFASLAAAGQKMIEGLGLEGRFEAHSDASGGCLLLEVVVEDEDAAVPGDEALIDLLADASDYRLVLVRGQFTVAEGFELSDENTVAAPLAPATEPETGQTLRWSLSWTTTPAETATGEPLGDPPVASDDSVEPSGPAESVDP